MSLLPKEHGAYGQISFPLIAALAVGGPTAAGLLTAGATAAAFLAHEPMLIVMGMRGPRARREDGPRASRWLFACAAAAMAAGGAALAVSPPGVRWAFAVPLAAAVWLAAAIAAGREKTWQGETAAALAFSLTAVPICLAGGTSGRVAAAVAIPFALLFVTATLAVQAVIVRVRAGGNLRASATLRRGVLVTCGTAAAGLVLAAGASVLPWTAAIASGPGLLVAAGIAWTLPAPARLRTVGWTLVAASVITTVAVIAGASLPSST